MPEKIDSGAILQVGLNTPFAEQISFFRQKLNLPSERWDDIRRAAHDRAFMVAGAMKADLLNDLRGAVDKSIAEGKSLGWFRKEFAAIVGRHGWQGWTGEGSPEGFAWRTRVIYQTNLATSYAAGRYRQLTDPELLTLRPYWRYKHADGVANPRLQHVAWNGLTLRHDHPFWQTHFPPNGWGCHCSVQAVSRREYVKAQAAGLGEPPEGWDAIDEKTGEPAGIARGFGYAPGASVNRPLKEFIDQKLINLDAPVGAAMYETLRPVLVDEMRQAVAVLVDRTAATSRATGEAALAHVVAPRTVADLAARGLPLASADVWLRDEELLHALRETKGARGAALPLEVWRNLPAALDGATPYLDTNDPALVYVFDLSDGVGKVLVRVNYADKIRLHGERTKLTSNFVRTGGVIEARNVSVGSQYVQLDK
ncbi:MAG: phage minor head protein [Azonexus sp.]